MLRTSIALLALVVRTATLSYTQQNDAQRLSPPASASCKFDDGKVIRTDHFSPRLNGRRILGGVVPYSQRWRTGANEATTFVTYSELKVGGMEIPVGGYTLFSLPTGDRWTLIISKKTREPSIPYPELLRVGMKLSETKSPLENFTIVHHKKDATCSLSLSWENTEATVDLAEKKLCWPTTSPLTYSCPDQ